MQLEDWNRGVKVLTDSCQTPKHPQEHIVLRTAVRTHNDICSQTISLRGWAHNVTDIMADVLSDVLVEVTLSVRGQSWSWDAGWHVGKLGHTVADGQHHLLLSVWNSLLVEHLPWVVGTESEVSERLDPRQGPVGWTEEGLPVVCLHNHSSTFCANKLGNVDMRHWCALSDDFLEVFQARDMRAAKASLHQPKTPVRGKLGVSGRHKVDGNRSVLPCLNTPRKVEKNPSVFVLAGTIVTVQLDRLLPKAIVFKKEVQVADDSVAPLTRTDGLIDQKVYLLRQALTVNSKYSALAGCQEVEGSWLRSITRIVDLLGKVEAVVHCKISGILWSMLELMEAILLRNCLGCS